jgi:hypothetical protein
MAEFIKKTVTGQNKGTNPDILDISNLTSGRQNAIKWMSENNITILDNGKYNPQNTVNRGAMAEFMYKTADAFAMMDLSLDPLLYVNEEKKFIKDKALQELKVSNPARYYAIMWLVKMNITEGYNEKRVLSYRPWNVVTRGAMAQFLQKLFFVMRTKEPLVSPNDKDAVMVSGYLYSCYYNSTSSGFKMEFNEFFPQNPDYTSIIRDKTVNFFNQTFCSDHDIESVPDRGVFYNFYVLHPHVLNNIKTGVSCNDRVQF